MTRLLAMAERRNEPVLVAFIDLDNFKAINDTHGHDVGDLFLVAVADRLRSALRIEDLAAHFGGDEFVVATLGFGQEGLMELAASALQDRLYRATLGHYALDGVRMHYGGASVGVLLAPPGQHEVRDVLRNADATVYRVKRQRRSANAADRCGT